MPTTKTDAAGQLLNFEDIAVGQKFTTKARMEAAAMDTFRTLSGDCNPLHTDREAARQQGFPERSIYGFLMLCLLSRIVGNNFRNAVCAALSTDFSNPAFCGDQVTVEAEIVHLQSALSSAVFRFRIDTSAALVARGKLTIKFIKGIPV